MTPANAGSDPQYVDELNRLRRMVSLESVGTWDWDLRTSELVWSRAHYRLFGMAADAVSAPVSLDAFFARVHPDDHEATNRLFAEARATRQEFAAEFRIIREDSGEIRWIEARGTFFHDGNEATHVAGIVMDITARRELEARVENASDERRRLEQQLHQAQKMEAIGQLAGGVAHDFNNLLTVIMGNVEFVRGLGVTALSAQAELDEIEQATNRARTLVAQLLAFSRKQVVQIRTLDLHDIVRATEPMLRRVLGEQIALHYTIGGDVLPIAADRGQLEQVLLNLVVNARDAMLTAAHGHHGTGGTLEIITRRITLPTGASGAWPSLAAGDYAELAIRDTGHGMPPEIRDRMFEPFFTTKPLGSGTGLGLSQVVGIVEQCGGAIQVETAPGQGTMFVLRFPARAAVTPTEDDHLPTSIGSAGAHTILLVEDEPAVRRALARMLQALGQQVLTAADGAEGLSLWEAHRDEISAIVTDVRMPHMNGRVMADAVRERAETLPIVFVSGYAADDTLVKTPRDVFVPKPLTTTGLAEALTNLGVAPKRPTPRSTSSLAP